MPLNNDKENFDFVAVLQDHTGLSDEGIEAFIERLSVDEMLTLIDAVVDGDTESMQRIVGQYGKVTEAMKRPTQRNPMARELRKNPLFKPKVEKSERAKTDRNDGWNRNAKHKNNKESETMTESFKPGERVSVKGKTGIVKVGNGPGNTVGVKIDGTMSMVDRKDVKAVKEDVDFDFDPDMARLQTLAGIKQPPLADLPPVDSATITTGPDIDHDVPGYDAGGESDFGDEGFGDDYDEPAPAPMMAPVDGGGDIFGAITQVEELLPQVKVRDFKQVVSRLRDLVTNATTIGRANLAEAKARRARALNEEDETSIGQNRAEAVAALHQRMGGKPEQKRDAEKAFDKLRSTGKLRMANGSFSMPAMGDEEFQDSLK